ncbi:MAG TPA: insulinase family protein [Elusimicrobia bacterium]|nr:insulinase family protein [Elusimicrobiota bacterium]
MEEIMNLSALLPGLLLLAAPLSVKAADAKALEKLGASVETDPKYPPVVSYTLKNGLRLLILEKKFAPTVSFAMTFKVGNVDCPSGKTGLAHVFEHMAFKGTETMNTRNYSKEKKVLDKIEATAQALIAEESRGASADRAKVEELTSRLSALEKEAGELSVSGEFTSTYEKLGANGMNAATAVDYTVYQVSLPADRVEAWMIMESDRFKNPVLREFYKERSVIMEELRMGESKPGSVLFENLSAAAFKAHPYHNPTIGWMDDLKKLTRTDAERFYETFYVPNNATLAIVGDVDAEKIVRMTEKYFGGWRAKALPSDAYTAEPEQDAERRVNVFFDAKPAFYMGFHNPGEAHPDTPALIMLSEVLSNGKTGRFYRNLVEGKSVALYAGSHHSLPGSRYPSLFLVAGYPKEPHTSADLEAAVWEEIEAVKKTPPTDWEMEKIINNYESEMVRGLESDLNFAKNISNNDRIMGDWKYDWALLARLKGVKPEEVSAAAGKYLKRSNYTIVSLAPKGAVK